LALYVELDGTTSLWNTTSSPISFEGYSILSETSDLDPSGWKSVSDYFANGETDLLLTSLGAGSLGFSEAGATATGLSELSLTGMATIQPGAKFAIGKPFSVLPPSNGTSAAWKDPSGSIDIVYAPEPGTWLLATLAGLGLVAMRVRSKR
jgi:hypothetical protein